MTHHMHRDGTAALERSGALDGIDWTLAVRPRRRSIGVEVKAGAVVIAVPPQVSIDLLVGFIDSKRHWIRKHAAESEVSAPCGVSLADGESFDFLGDRLALHLVDGAARNAERTAARLTVPRQAVHAHGSRPLVDWYRSEGERWAQRRAEYWMARLGLDRDRPGLHVVDLGVRRWGVYRPRYHRVELHWPLFQLPEALAEYVLVHELVHATRPRGTAHGEEWRRRMGAALPDWRRLQKRTREAGRSVWSGRVGADGN